MTGRQSNALPQNEWKSDPKLELTGHFSQEILSLISLGLNLRRINWLYGPGWARV